MKVLVAYATRHNSTAEIATCIGDKIKQFSSLDVDVLEVTTVRNINIYNAVILGSAVYMGNWQLQGINFLKKYVSELSQRPVWLFSSGPTGRGEPKGMMSGWEFPEQLKPFKDQIKPREIAFFHGKLDMDELNLLERSAVKLTGAPLGDYRDWNSIDQWASEIGEFLEYESREIVSGR